MTKGAHGAKSKQVLVAHSSNAFKATALKKSSIRLRVTGLGHQALRGRRSIKLTVKATFRIANDKPVTWTETFVLRG